MSQDASRRHGRRGFGWYVFSWQYIHMQTRYVSRRDPVELTRTTELNADTVIICYFPNRAWGFGGAMGIERHILDRKSVV